MANTTVSELPLAIALSGAELIGLSAPTGLSQSPWTSERATISMIWSGFGGGGTNASCSLRQWLAAVATPPAGSNSGAINLFNSVPADITNATWIQYNRGSRVVLGDLLYTQTQSVLGYSNVQMLALMAAAQALPF